MLVRLAEVGRPLPPSSSAPMPVARLEFRSGLPTCPNTEATCFMERVEPPKLLLPLSRTSSSRCCLNSGPPAARAPYRAGATESRSGGRHGVLGMSSRP